MRLAADPFDSGCDWQSSGQSADGGDGGVRDGERDKREGARVERVRGVKESGETGGRGVCLLVYPGGEAKEGPGLRGNTGQ